MITQYTRATIISVTRRGTISVVSMYLLYNYYVSTDLVIHCLVPISHSELEIALGCLLALGNILSSSCFSYLTLQESHMNSPCLPTVNHHIAGRWFFSPHLMAHLLQVGCISDLYAVARFTHIPASDGRGICDTLYLFVASSAE